MLNWTQKPLSLLRTDGIEGLSQIPFCFLALNQLLILKELSQKLSLSPQQGKPFSLSFRELPATRSYSTRNTLTADPVVPGGKWLSGHLSGDASGIGQALSFQLS